MSVSEVLFIVVQLIFLEGILSIDNAAVLGAMVSVLPANQPIPWPRALHFMRGRADKLFGGQRAAALKVGLIGAYAGRALMLLLAAIIIRNPWLRLLGAAYLFKLAIEHLGDHHEPDEEDAPIHVGAEKGFWGVVLAVELADLAFSLDNVVAAVALSDHILIVMVGVALGILTMRFAAQVFTLMIEREPVLVTAAYILVLNISLELLIEDLGEMAGLAIHFASWQKFLISLITLALAVIYARLPVLQRLLRPILRLLAHVFHTLNDAIDILLTPLSWMFRGMSYGFQQLFPAFATTSTKSER